MNVNIEQWFPSPVLWADVDLGVAERIRTDFLAKEDKIKLLLNTGTWGDNITSSFGTPSDFITLFELHELGKVVDAAAGSLFKAFNQKEKLVRLESWVNYQNKYQYQDSHSHPWSVVSVVYYIQATTLDGAFRVHPPKTELGIWNLMPDGRVSEMIDYKPRTGLVLAIPSSTDHSVSQNMTDNTRISIACNYEIERQK